MGVGVLPLGSVGSKGSARAARFGVTADDGPRVSFCFSLGATRAHVLDCNRSRTVTREHRPGFSVAGAPERSGRRRCVQ